MRVDVFGDVQTHAVLDQVDEDLGARGFLAKGDVGLQVRHDRTLVVRHYQCPGITEGLKVSSEARLPRLLQVPRDLRAHPARRRWLVTHTTTSVASCRAMETELMHACAIAELYDVTNTHRADAYTT